ncbi:hypothetical protein [Actinopolyspora halophila]|uniref:hypothetical protein n=1 Tax=Actinopolyspora halophila TaxID=1850 RepID=UPI00037676C8|nr:hypothetical protein [Actinopolyspora halophila]
MTERLRQELVERARRDLHARRGPSRRPVATTAWLCEGHWQADDQMDIWQCADEVALDAMRARGEEVDEHDHDEA